LLKKGKSCLKLQKAPLLLLPNVYVCETTNKVLMRVR
jgi:hypothetical protein